MTEKLVDGGNLGDLCPLFIGGRTFHVAKVAYASDDPVPVCLGMSQHGHAKSTHGRGQEFTLHGFIVS